MSKQGKEPKTSEVKGSIKDDIKINKLKRLSNDLEALLIDPKEPLQPPPTAWKILEENGDQSILGTLGNFSLVIGKAKSKKTFFIGITVATAISKDIFFNKFQSELPDGKEEVLYFDTEQGKYHVQSSLKRICKLTGIEEPSNLKVYGLRSKKPQDRLSLIEHAINTTPNLGFVVIDGIKDLVTSINSEEEATSIASCLLKWTEEKGIHIITVLHQNKSDFNARGHIGTELVNKAETVISISVDEKERELSIVEAQQCRNKEFQKFAFEIDENSLPRIVYNFVDKIEVKETVKNHLLALSSDDSYLLLSQIFERNTDYNYGELVIQIKLTSKDFLKKNIGDNKIKEFITHCKNNGWLFQDARKKPYKLVSRSEFEESKDSYQMGDYQQ
ncbi:AAA family ATPase [Lutimonas saemankumensis]|uniref:AAA family ATPase n=1 Tax=Lutimonas saemankumensis TaxID=483016 RepID=UPI001CD78D9F|nr:AAA family ATPase [Lutimonas saemankumensis]MCA0933093.1 AAA family ATPase [Lutimonas saemankumensis]